VAGKYVFISHSSHDAPAAQRILKALEARGLSCWISSRDVRPGDNFASAIVEAIENAYAMVLVFSSHANQRAEEIKKEIVLAGQNNLVVLPARIENLLPSDRAFRYEMATRQWVDLFDNWDAGIDRMATTLTQLAPAAGNAAPGVKPAAETPPRPSEPTSYNIRVPRRVLSRPVVALGVVGLLAAAGLGGWQLWEAYERGQRRDQAERARQLTADGLKLLQTGQYQKCLEELDKAIALEPAIGDAWKWRGGCHFQLGQFQNAARDYSQTVKLDPEDFEVWRTLGVWVYPRLSDTYGARRALDAAVKLRPTSPQALFDRANARYNTADNDGAIVDLNEALRIDPRFAEAWRLRGWVYAISNFDRAWPDFEQAIRLEPRNPRNYQLRADLRQRAGDVAGAQADRAQAQALGSTPTAPAQAVPAQAAPPQTKR
jgi:tetratricopeptide (TPR) repeat protein